jgi:thioredoxin-related protein
MKTQSYILILFVALTCSMCNSSKKEEKTIQKITESEKESEHKILSPADSLKLVNHQIEIKGDVEFPLELNVDSLRKMKVVNLNDFKVVCQSGATKKTDATCKGVLLKDILEKSQNQTKGP